MHGLEEAGASQVRAPRNITPLELADFQLACWRQIFIEDAPSGTIDGEEGAWLSEWVATFDDQNIWERWVAIHDRITGSDLGETIEEGLKAIEEAFPHFKQ
jgi:hypothetical protein